MFASALKEATKVSKIEQKTIANKGNPKQWAEENRYQKNAKPKQLIEDDSPPKHYYIDFMHFDFRIFRMKYPFFILTI